MSPIVSPRPRADSRRPTLRALSPAERSTPPQNRPDAAGSHPHPRPARPALRVVPDGARRESVPHVPPVLLAGADARARAMLRAEFGATLPSRTRWVEADDLAGVLERAAYSRMAILAGDLDDADTESLMHLLGRRHPELPVICVDAPLPTAAGGRG